MQKAINRRKYRNIWSEDFSETFFKTVFRSSPIAMIIIDGSKVQYSLMEQSGGKTIANFVNISGRENLMLSLLRDLRILAVNKSAIDLLDANSDSEFISKFFQSISKASQKTILESVVSFQQGMNFFEGDVSVHSLKGEKFDCLLRGSVPKSFQKSLDFIILTLIDITARKAMERHLRKMAQLDGLTRLLNHFAVVERLNEELNRSKRYGIDVTCFMIDVDRFKLINDKFGHQKGDQILKKVAALIKDNLRRTDIVGRYGGDEFLVILPETKPKNAKIPALRIQRAFQEIIAKSLRTMPKFNTLSIGISGFPSKGISNAKELIESADQAMYKAKGITGDRVVIN